MHIINQQHKNNNLCFNGELIVRGKKPYADLKKEFLNNPAVVEFLKSNKNLIARVKSHECDTHDIRYNISLSAEKEHPNVLEKFTYILGLNKKIDITRAYLKPAKANKCIGKSINPEVLQTLN